MKRKAVSFADFVERPSQPPSYARACTQQRYEDNKLDQSHLDLVREIKTDNEHSNFQDTSQDMAPTFSRQTTGEISQDRWTTAPPVRTAAQSIHAVDLNQTYTPSLKNWVPLSWEKVLKLQVGSWVQYTTTKYPEFVNRKKVLCVVGNGILGEGKMEVEGGEREMFMWTVLQDKKEAVKNHRPEKPEWVACSRGRHSPIVLAESNGLMGCEHCSCRGWRMTKGRVHHDRHFYVNPFVRFIKE
jgi:hypothetical protein